MKHSFLVLLLLCFVMLMHSQVQGIRLGKSLLASLQVQQEKVQYVAVDSNIKPGDGNNYAEVEFACHNRRCTKTGDYRKPIPTSFSSASTSTTNEQIMSNPNSKLMDEAIDKKFDGHEKNFAVDSPTAAASSHSKETPEHLPDIIDLAGMDYSPARRKTPIHN